MKNYLSCILMWILLTVNGHVVTASAMHIGPSNERESQESSSPALLSPADGSVTQDAEITFISHPQEYPILVDNMPMGNTSPAGRKLKLSAGVHTFVVHFPDGTRWIRTLNLTASTKNCSVTLSYNASGTSIGKVTESFINCGISAQDTSIPSGPSTRCTRLVLAECSCWPWPVRIFVKCPKNCR